MNPGTGAGQAGGLFAALRSTATTLLATARTRVELAGNDLAFERDRLLRALILGVAALFCLGLGVLLALGLVVALYWENRVALLASFAALFLLAAAALVAGVLRTSRSRQPFAATLAELEEDLRQLRAASGASAHGRAHD